MFPLQLLLLEPNLLDTQKLQTTLSSGGIDCQLLRVDTRADFVKALETNPFDLILSDYSLPGFDGRTALEIARQQRPETPFVFVSTSVGEELAIAALEAGAAGFVLKHRLERLVPCIKRVLPENSRYPSTEVALREENDPNWAAVKQAGAALRNAQARLRAVAANLPQGAVFVLDLDLRYLLAEGKALEAAGMTSKDLVGKTIWEALDPVLAAKYEPYFRQALRGEPFQLEHYSHDRHYVSHGTPLYNNQGEIYAVLAKSYDISDRKHVEVALRESEEKFRAFVSTASDIIYEMSADWGEMRFLEGKEFIATTENPRCDWMEAYIPETDKPRGRAAIARAIATRSNFELEHRVIRLDGTVGWAFSRAIPLINEAGEIIKWFGATSDITDWVEAEAALRESEAKYRTLFESIDEGFAVFEMIDDQNGRAINYRFLEVNSVFERQTGLVDAAGKLVSEIDPNIESYWFETFDTVVQTGESVRLENYNQSTGRWYSVYASRIDGEGSRQVCIVFDDISDRKRQEQRQAFLLKLGDALRPLSDATEIQRTAMRVLGEHFALDRAMYAEITPDGETVIVNDNYLSGRFPPFTGEFPLASYGSIIDKARSGEPMIVADVDAITELTEAEKMNYKEIGSTAFVTIPLIKGGRWVSNLVVHQGEPRRWTTEEIAVLQETAERTWAAVERARAEAALRESEEKYRSLFESMSEGLAINELVRDESGRAVDARYLELNPAYGRQTGFDRSSTLGRLASEVFPDYYRSWLEIVERVLRTGQQEYFEHFVLDNERWFAFHVAPFGGADRFTVFYDDITERKQSEEQLRRAAEMNAFRVELSDTLRSLSNPIETQAEACRLLGEHLGVDRAYYVEVNEAEGYARVNQNYLRGDSPSLVGVFQLADYGWTLPLLQRSETIIVVDAENSDVIPEADRMAMAAVRIAAHISTPLVKAGTLMGALCVTECESREWTETEIELVRETAERIWAAIERARAEEIVAADLRDTQLLQELGARLVTEGDIQTLYQEILSAAIALTHADAGTVQILDNATQELLTLASRGFSRTVFEHFYRLDASSNTSCGIALRTGERTFIDFDVPASEDPDGSCRMHVEAGYLSAQSTPLIARSGRAVGMVSTHWHDRRRPSDRELRFLDLLARQAADLIEQRQTEAEREKLLACEQTARAEANRANRFKDEFLAVLSHELRSPLNPILGWTHLLQSGKLDANRQREGLATIERNAKLQTQLIGDLLDISHIMQGKLSLNVDSVSLTFVITAAVETVRLAAEAKQIQILLDITAEIAPVSGDAARLQQVVCNLLTNAVKFTPNGGRVTVELRQIDRGAQIRVIDTGKGIEPQFLPHVFEYFRQADSTTTRQFGGLGLGLAIVQQIVERHGGTVKVESLGENQGATFIVQLPVIGQAVKMKSELSQAQAENLEASLNNLQILLVDDEADTLEFQAFLLEQSGAKVVAVASSSEALQVLDRFIPDVLISDIGMAEMDGYMLIQHIRSRPPEREGTIPAIALTAYARDFDQQKAFQSGFQAHITKPVEPDMLIKTITRLLCSNNL